MSKPEPKANPYNRKKSWHKPDKADNGRADSMFFAQEEDEATPDEAPQTQSEVDYKKRYDDLKKHYDQKINSMKQSKEQEEAVDAVRAQPQQMPENLAAFQKEYPDLFKNISSLAELKTAEGTRDMEAQVQAIAAKTAEVTKREALLVLQQRHPDFDKIKEDDAFHAWAEAQPEEIQDWIYRNPDNPDLASRAIDFYKAEKGIKSSLATKPRSQSNADLVSTKSAAPEVRQAKIWKLSEIDRLTPDQYDKYEAEIDKAVAEGRVVKG